MTRRQHHRSLPSVSSWNTECTHDFILTTHFLFVLSLYFEGYQRLEAVFFKTRPPRMQGDQIGNHIHGAPTPQADTGLPCEKTRRLDTWRTANHSCTRTTHTRTHTQPQGTSTWAQILNALWCVSVQSSFVTLGATLDPGITGIASLDSASKGKVVFWLKFPFPKRC